MAISLAVGGVQALAQTASEKTDLAEVTITGSRITGNTISAVPLTSLDSQALELSGTTKIGDALANIPTLVSSLGSTTSNANNVGGGGMGLSTIALRGLGSQRTLVLINGRRTVAGVVAQSAVDLNTIPQELVDHIDVITGGASAIYGSEAIAGVVNIVTKKKMEGIEVSAQYGLSSRSDGRDRSVSLIGGTRFANDRGNFLFDLSYENLSPIFTKDRDFSKNSLRINPVTGALTISYLPVAPSGAFTAGPASSPCFGPCLNWDGTPFVPSVDGIDTGQQRGIQVPIKRYLASAQFDYSLTDNVQLFGEFSYARTQSRILAEPPSIFTGITITFTDPSVPPVPFTVPADNPLIPESLLQALYPSTGGVPPPGARLNIDRNMVEWGGRQAHEERQTFRNLLGFKGDLRLGGRDVFWELYGSFGHMGQEHKDRGQANQLNLANAFNVVPDPSSPGSFMCADAAARAAGCVPLNVWGPGNVTPEAVDYTRHTAFQKSFNDQSIVATNISSQPFDLPAGPFGIAIGGEWRRERASTTPDELVQHGQSTLGQRAAVQGEIDVTEGYIELSVPLLKDKPFARMLSIDLAERVADYSTIGNEDSWKVGADWTIVNGFRLRGTRASAVRAPNVTELFSPGEFAIGGPSDPCDKNQVNSGLNPSARRANCAAAIPGYDPTTFTQTGQAGIAITTLGSTDLEAETANSYTIGFVAQPAFLPNFTLSTDYYNITVDGAIQSLTSDELVSACYDQDSFPNEFCDSISRDPVTNQLVRLTTKRINFARIQTAGFDIQSNYLWDLNDRGKLNFNLTATRLTQFETTTLSTLPAEDRLGVIRYPEWSGYLQSVYRLRNFTASWTMRYLDSVSINPTTKVSPFPGSKISSYVYHDISLAYEFGQSLKVYGGVKNLFDKQPPVFGSNIRTVDGAGNQVSCNTACDVYDPIGAFFYLGLKANF